MIRIKAIAFLLALSAIAIGNSQAMLQESEKFYLVSSTGQKFEVPGQLLMAFPSFKAMGEAIEAKGEEARSLPMQFDNNAVEAIANAMNAFVKYPEKLSKVDVFNRLKEDLKAMLQRPVGEQIKVLEAAHYAGFQPLDDLLLAELAKSVVAKLTAYPSVEQLNFESNKMQHQTWKHPLWKKELARQYYLRHGEDLPDKFIDPKSYSFSLAELIDSKIIDLNKRMNVNNELNLSKLRLNSVEGLSEFSRLDKVTTLYLDKNQLTQLPANFLANAPALKTLLLGQNQLTQLPDGFLANAPALKELWLDENQLTQLPDGFLANAPVLEELWLKQNQLTQLPGGFLANASALEYLWLDQNQLTQLPDGFLANSPDLKILGLNENQLRQLPANFLANAPVLEGLRLNENQLRQLPANFLANAPVLEYLWLDENQLTQLPDGFLANSPDLKILGLDQNQLTQLPDGFLANAPVAEVLGLFLKTN